MFADLILLRNIVVDFSSFGNRLAPELGLFGDYDLVKGLYFGKSVKKTPATAYCTLGGATILDFGHPV